MDIEARLASKLTKLFPEKEDRNEAIALLESYGQESYEQEPTRVRLAILKLAGQSPSIAELKKYTDAAKGDFRDVLSWESRGQTRRFKKWNQGVRLVDWESRGQTRRFKKWNQGVRLVDLKSGNQGVRLVGLKSRLSSTIFMAWWR